MFYNADQIELLEMLKNDVPVCLMVAPSFVVDFNYKKFVPLMKGLGFSYVSEVTFGARTINKEYQKYIKNNLHSQEKFIASVCPMIVNLIKIKHPDMVKYLLPFDSPMIAMAKILKKNFAKEKIVFLSPCFAKKIEAKSCKEIDLVITFKELKEIIKTEKPVPKKCSHLFDRFYNDYTKIYPLSGGLVATLHSKGIFAKEEMFSCDNCNITKALKSKEGVKFFDFLFCNGGCIGGNGVNAKTPTFMKKQSVLSYKKTALKEKIGFRKGMDKYTNGIDFSKVFE